MVNMADDNMIEETTEPMENDKENECPDDMDSESEDDMDEQGNFRC